ncbi:uncharacterized protein LOC135098029 isoform X2 [Scylla paramamosain]|uniref:uncharacterized protein LOC135098029 isoform X2 n=1 Tax=Scylla paramamosain TaxID=85552 RepID=UPI003083C329
MVRFWKRKQGVCHHAAEQADPRRPIGLHRRPLRDWNMCGHTWQCRGCAQRTQHGDSESPLKTPHSCRHHFEGPDKRNSCTSSPPWQPGSSASGGPTTM